MGNKSKVTDDQILSYLKEGHRVKETASHLHVDNGRVGQLARAHGLIKYKGPHPQAVIKVLNELNTTETLDNRYKCPNCTQNIGCHLGFSSQYDCPAFIESTTIDYEWKQDPYSPPPITTTDDSQPPTDLADHQMDNLQAAKNLMLNYLEKLEADRQILSVRCVLQQKVHIVQNYVQPYLARLEMDIKLFEEMVNNL